MADPKKKKKKKKGKGKANAATIDEAVHRLPPPPPESPPPLNNADNRCDGDVIDLDTENPYYYLILQAVEERDSFESQLKVVRECVAKYAEELLLVGLELEEKTAELKKVRKQFTKSQTEMAKLKSKLARWEEQQTLKETQTAADHVAERNAYETRISELKNKINGLRVDLNRERANAKRANERRKNAESAPSQLKVSLAKADKKIKNQTQQLSGLLTRILALKTLIKQLEGRLEKEAGDRERVEEELVTSRNTHMDLLAQHFEMRGERDAALLRADTAEGTLQSETNRANAAEARIAELESIIAERNAKIASLKERLTGFATVGETSQRSTDSHQPFVPAIPTNTYTQFGAGGGNLFSFNFGGGS